MVALESLRGPHMTGSFRRLALSCIIDCLAEPWASSSDTLPALRLSAELARRFGLPRVGARALAILGRLALASNRAAEASTAIDGAVASLETEDHRAWGGADWPLHSLPREIRDLARAFFDGGGGCRSRFDSPPDARILLHAMAHRISRLSRSALGIDSRRESALRAVLTSAAQIKTGLGVEVLLSVLSEHARAITRAERACVVLVSQTDGERRIAGSSGADGAAASLMELSRTVIERALKTRTPLLLHDVFGDSELMARPSIVAMSLRSILCVPLMRGSDVFGVMYAG